MNLTNQKLNQAIKLIQDCIKSEDVDIPQDRPLVKGERNPSGIIEVKKSTNLSITLNDNEQKAYDDFYEAHKGCQKYTGAIGVNNVRLIATGTSMGWMFECECSRCGEKKSITDVDSW